MDTLVVKSNLGKKYSNGNEILSHDHHDYTVIYNIVSVVAGVIFGSTVQSFSYDDEKYKFNISKINPSKEWDNVNWEYFKQYMIFHHKIIKLCEQYYQNNSNTVLYQQILSVIAGSKDKIWFKKTKAILDEINIDKEVNIEFINSDMEIINLIIVPKKIIQFSKNFDDESKYTIIIKAELSNIISSGIQFAFGDKNSQSVSIPAYRFNEVLEIKNGAYLEVEIKSNSKTGYFKRVIIKNDDS